MPRIFNPVDISQEEKELRKDYFDRHTPVLICDSHAAEGEKFKVKIRLGTEYMQLYSVMEPGDLYC